MRGRQWEEGRDPEVSAIVAEGLIRSADAAAAEGVRQALHPHVGSWVETEEEIRSVLDASAGSNLGFGPDVGHLYWGGTDPARIISDYANRVLAMHLKDVDKAAMASAATAGADYWQATGHHHVWTEPGRGHVDLDAALAALPADFGGWFVIEVDVPNLPTPLESSRTALEYVSKLPYFSEVTA